MSTDAANVFLLHAQSGDLEGVRLYLANGGDPNFVGQPRGITALLLAVKEGHIAVVKELLDNGADVNCKSDRGLSCVHTVARTGDDKMFDLLLEHGLHDMNAKWIVPPSAYSSTAQSPSVYLPLYMAAQENNTGVMELMLLHGADPLLETEIEPGPVKMLPCEVSLNLGKAEAVNLFVLWCHRLGPFAVDKVRELPNHTPDSAATLRAAIMDKLENLAAIAYKREMDNLRMMRDTSILKYLEAAENGAIEVMEAYVFQHGVNDSSPMGLSALHLACIHGNMKSISFLPSHGACVNTQSESGLTPLYMAAQTGHRAVVELLLTAGADPGLGLKCGIAPLGVALTMEHHNIVAAILERCPLSPAVSTLDLKYINKQPDRLLLRAAEKGNLEEVQYCINDLGMNPNKVTSLMGIKAVHFACKGGHVAVLNELLNHGANINCRTKKGHEPLHCAASGGHLDVLTVLLQHNAHVNARNEEIGSTPLFVACKMNYVSCVQELLLNGADPLMAVRGEYPFTCVDIARLHMCVDTMNCLLLWAFRLGPFSHLDHNLEETCYSEDNAEMVQTKIIGRIGELAMSMQLKEFDFMQKAGTDPMHRTLEEAVTGNMNYFVDDLHPALNLPMSTASNLTTLHCASFGGHMELVRFLLQSGADLNKQSKAGFTALYLAAQQGQLEVVETLLKAGADTTLYSKIGLTAVGVAMYTRQRPVVISLLDTSPSVPPIHPGGTYCKQKYLKDKKKSGCVIV